jgi:GNAT superfamily N-acetyltransferase
MHLRIEISHVSSAGEATSLDELLWTVLWRPLGLPRDCRGSFALAGDETELIARDGARIVGGLVAVQRGLAFTEIRHLAIEPQFQGRGIGQALLRKTERMTRERGVAHLRTIARNTSAGFFMRQGLVPTGEAAPGHPAFRAHWIFFVVLEKRLVPEFREDRQECLSRLGGSHRHSDQGIKIVDVESPFTGWNNAAPPTPRPWRTPGEANAWAVRAQGDLRLDPAEREALVAFQDRSTGIRERLTDWINRGGPAPDRRTRALADRIDAVISRSSTTIPGFAFRCLDLAAGNLRYNDRAYMSSTLCGAAVWQRHGLKADDPVLIKIHLPRGTRGIYLPLLTGIDPEPDRAEFLLQRGTMLVHDSEFYGELDGRNYREVMVTVSQSFQNKPSQLEWHQPE